LPSSKILVMMSLHGITRWWLFVSPPTQESSSVVHLHHHKHSRHVCNLHMKWQISVKSHFIIKWLVSLAFLSN
jgi:hypothetical protein